MRIAHISDLHICTENRPENIKRVERILSAITHSNTDHLVITGDMSHDAKPKDLGVLRNLLLRYGFLKSEKLSVVIGNHDVFGGIHLAEEIFEFPRRCKETDYKNQIKKFSHFFRESFEGTFRPIADSYFPYFKKLDDVLLVGINSIAPYSKLKNPVVSNGRIANEEFEAVKETLSSPDYENMKKIGLIHHHFMPKLVYHKQPDSGIWKFVEHHTMKLFGKSKVIKMFAKNDLRLVLHGHVHDNRKYRRNGVEFLNGGGSVGDWSESALKINYVIKERDNFKIIIERLEPESLIYDELPIDEALVPQFAG
jgi:3',5'-cyclic AMP phosphodiesterase CpdA